MEIICTYNNTQTTRYATGIQSTELKLLLVKRLTEVGKLAEEKENTVGSVMFLRKGHLSIPS
jgi:hypothetical protein